MTSFFVMPLNQGDLLPDLQRLPALATTGEVHWVECPHGAVVVTQTCDALRDVRI